MKERRSRLTASRRRGPRKEVVEEIRPLRAASPSPLIYDFDSQINYNLLISPMTDAQSALAPKSMIAS